MESLKEEIWKKLTRPSARWVLNGTQNCQLNSKTKSWLSGHRYHWQALFRQRSMLLSRPCKVFKYLGRLDVFKSPEKYKQENDFFSFLLPVGIHTKKIDKYTKNEKKLPVAIKCHWPPKTFLESSRYRTRPLETTGYWPWLTHYGTNRIYTLVWSWWYKSNKRGIPGLKTRIREASWAERRLAKARLWVPNPYCIVPAAAGNVLAVRAPRHRCDTT